MMMMTLYPWQEECINFIKDKNAIVAAPTGAGKTRVAIAWMNPLGAVKGEHRAYYCTPVKALAYEVASLLRELFGDVVGVLTGDIKKKHDAPIVVCSQETFARMIRGGKIQMPARVVIDEFHTAFTDPERSRAYVDALRYSPPTHLFLLMSATFSNLKEIVNYVSRVSQRQFVLYETDFRPTELFHLHDTFTPDTIPMYSLVYIFSIEALKKLTKYLSVIRSPLPVLQRRRIKQIADAYFVNLESFPEIMCGVAQYHSRMTYTQKRFVSTLARENFLRILCSTTAVGVGVNLPFQYALFGSMHFLVNMNRVPLSKTEFVQLSGRVGRPGFFDTGYTALLQQPYTRNYEDFTLIRDHYTKLIDPQTPLEEPKILLQPNVEAVVKGEVSIEDELNYIASFSLPPLTDEEIERYRRMLTDVVETTKRLSPQETRLLKRFYMPHLTFSENLKLIAFLRSHPRNTAISAENLSFLGDLDDLQNLLRIRRVLLALKDAKLNVNLASLDERLFNLDPYLAQLAQEE